MRSAEEAESVSSGTCRVCGQVVPLLPSGRIAEHNAMAVLLRQVLFCLGSGLTPSKS